MLQVHSLPSALKVIKLGFSFGLRVRNAAQTRLFWEYQTTPNFFSEAGLIKKQDRMRSVLVALISFSLMMVLYVNYV